MLVLHLGRLCSRPIELAEVLFVRWKSQCFDGAETLARQDQSRTQHGLHCLGLFNDIPGV